MVEMFYIIFVLNVFFIGRQIIKDRKEYFDWYNSKKNLYNN